MFGKNETVTLVLAFIFLLPAASMSAGIKPEERIASADKAMASMNIVLKVLVKAVAKAKQEKNVKKVNCLTEKLNLAKGLIKATQGAKVVLMEVAYAGDDTMADSYDKKVQNYKKTVAEIGDSISECGDVDVVGEGTTIVYVRPEKNPDLPQTGQTSPWDMENVDDPEGYPVVPPASPFR